MKVKLINESKNDLPEYKTQYSAGMDLRANLDEPITLQPMQRELISTGLYIELEEGYEAQIRPRSGIAFKEGLTVLNSPGTIDSDYRGEIKVLLINLSEEPKTIENSTRIAQMVIAPYIQAEILDTSEISETERGEKGFGSTGKK